MTINFVRLILIWLLPLTGSSTVTSGLHHNSTNVMTGNMRQKFNEDHLMTQQVSSLSAFSEVIQSIMTDVNPTEQKTTRSSTKPSLLTTLMKTFLPNIQTAATPTYSKSSQYKSSTVGIKSSTEVQLKFITSATTEVTSPASIPTTTTRAPLILTTSIQSQDTAKTMTSQFIPHPTSPTQSINFISTTKPVENKSTSLVTAGDTMQSTGFNATTPVTSSSTKKNDLPEEMGTYHNKVVAGVIGGALGLMMVGFLVICIKKRKLQRKQIATRHWAGPSPFIEGGADGGQVTLRASNQISLSSFLPQRLSKRLSLFTEIDEQFDMTPATTFGDKYQETISGRELYGNNVQKRKGTAIVVPEMKSMGDTPGMFENSVSASSSQENDLQSRDNNSEETNLSEDQLANPTSPSGAVEAE